MKKIITVTGVLTTLPSNKTITKGDGNTVMLTEWRMEAAKDNQHWRCVAWEEMAQKAMNLLTALQQKLTCEGLETINEFELNVRFIRIPDAPLTPREVLVRAYGGEAGLREARERLASQMAADGMVKVRIDRDGETLSVYKERRECIEWDGTLYDKLEWVMDILGGRYVSEKFKASQIGKRLDVKSIANASGDRGSGELVNSGRDGSSRSVYLGVLDELVKEAHEYIDREAVKYSEQ